MGTCISRAGDKQGGLHAFTVDAIAQQYQAECRNSALVPDPSVEKWFTLARTDDLLISHGDFKSITANGTHLGILLNIVRSHPNVIQGFCIRVHDSTIADVLTSHIDLAPAGSLLELEVVSLPEIYMQKLDAMLCKRSELYSLSLLNFPSGAASASHFDSLAHVLETSTAIRNFSISIVYADDSEHDTSCITRMIHCSLELSQSIVSLSLGSCQLDKAAAQVLQTCLAETNKLRSLSIIDNSTLGRAGMSALCNRLTRDSLCRVRCSCQRA